MLARLADYLEARQALRQKFTLALIYPVLVTIIALAVIAVLLIYVVPQVVAVYQQSRQTLPWLTQRADRDQSSSFARPAGSGSAALAAAVIGVCAREPARRRFARAGTRALLRVPVVGRLLRSLDTARFASTLAILVGSGAPLLRSLDAARDVVWVLPLQRGGARGGALVREGVSLARALKEQQRVPAGADPSRRQRRAERRSSRRCSSAPRASSSARPSGVSLVRRAAAAGADRG